MSIQMSREFRFGEYALRARQCPVSTSGSKSKMLRKVKVCFSLVKCSVVSMHKRDMTVYLKQEEAEEKQRFCVEPRGWSQRALLA